MAPSAWHPRIGRLIEPAPVVGKQLSEPTSEKDLDLYVVKPQPLCSQIYLFYPIYVIKFIFFILSGILSCHDGCFPSTAGRDLKPRQKP